MDRQLRDRGVEVEIPAGFPLCHFDDVLVEQLLINLLDNAVKYSPPESPILIRAEPLSNAAAIEVADRGEGFRPGGEARVFEMFYRGAEGEFRRRGSGLGLAICRAIAEAHGGSIHAANRPGGGAVLRFTLPFDGPPPQVIVEPETSAAQL
jgi:two-component system sensor histidine kinase KdpD